MNNTVSTIMTTDLVTLSPNSTLLDAQKIFEENHFHHIPVCTNGRLEGVITTVDLLKANKSSDKYDEIMVMEIMTRKLAVLNPTDKIGAASIVLLQNRFNSIPVVDEDRKLVGILTTFDLLKYQYQKEYPGDNFPFS